jgi:hypothetical protein
MPEVVLARLWQLPDGTSCLLVKDSQAGNWEARVVRNQQIIRSERFSHPIVAMDRAKEWRAAYDGPLRASAP